MKLEYLWGVCYPVVLVLVLKYIGACKYRNLTIIPERREEFLLSMTRGAFLKTFLNFPKLKYI